MIKSTTLAKNAARFWIILAVIATTCIVPLCAKSIDHTVAQDDPGKKNPESYWSTTNAPVFHGATKITLNLGAVDHFDPKDARFRIFARDFEDGDLTAEIQSTSNVDPSQVGTYTITHRVTDSHGNITTKEVPVTVRDTSSTADPEDPEQSDIIVERTLYTLPSTWNMSMAGFSRCNGGDRQILGIYLGAGQSAKARILSADNNIGVGFMANDSHKETSMSIPQSGEWVTLSNIKNDTPYDSVPVFSSTMLPRGVNQVNKTFRVELAYDKAVPSLNYYHQQDDEALFRAQWKAEQNTYGVIENEVLMMILPFADLDKTVNYHRPGFSTLDEHLEYYQKVVDKMDEYVGLDLNPEKVTDQNVRTQYLVKANAHGAGAAYYAGNHVGINNASMSSFFQMNWGGLHELAHGYQGSLGKGQMGLGEVGNNIIGHYIQIDKLIYTADGDWLGSLPVTESNRNAARESGSTFDQIDAGTRLYMIINLFDTFEGGTTYGKIFSWYREHLNDGTLIVDANANQDIYALAIGDIYHVDITPYMEAWGLNNATIVKDELRKQNYPLLSIMKDTLSDESLATVMSGENRSTKYGLTTADVYRKYQITGELQLQVKIDNIGNIKGKTAFIKDGDNIIREFTIESKNITLKDLPVGAYTLQMPVASGYFQDYATVVIKEGSSNQTTYTYTRCTKVEYPHTVYLRVLGNIFDTIAYQLTFSEDFSQATISYPNQSAMGGNEYIRIYDANGTLVNEDVATNGYFNFNQGTHQLDIAPGYVIEVGYPGKYHNKVKVFDNINPSSPELSSYRPTTAVTRYVVTAKGIRLESMTDSELDELNYQLLKQKLIGIIVDYQNTATAEELADMDQNFKTKANVVAAYMQLRPDDQVPYANFIQQITHGQEPLPPVDDFEEDNSYNPPTPGPGDQNPNDGDVTPNLPSDKPGSSSDGVTSLPNTGVENHADAMFSTKQTLLPFGICALVLVICYIGYSSARNRYR